MTIQNSKSILAKLLAQEDITVVHAKAPTASFDTANRVLTLPIWKEMDGDLYDLLVGHEVGHAEFTPPEGWHNAICGPDGDVKNADHAFKSFLNVIEDARIEKKIKNRFPGLRASFYRAYHNLHERDFFEVKDKIVADLLFIDRINLHFKLGSFIAVPFSEEEKVYIQRMEKLDTWEEVEALARELYEKAKDELKQGKRKIKLRLTGAMEDGDTGGEPLDIDLEDIDEIEIDDEELTEQERELLNMSVPVAETDTSFRSKENELLDEKSLPYSYYTLADIDSRPFVVPYKKVLTSMDFTASQFELIPSLVKEFRNKNDKYVNYLVKEFELKRNAQQQARAKISKSGELDMKKVFNYQISEDLFRRFTTLPNGKNHGLIMMFDMSGSMGNQMHGVIEQMLVLVEFCRKVNIPFEVYGFTNLCKDMDYIDSIAQRDVQQPGEVMIWDGAFTLRQYFTDKMRPSEYKTMLGQLVLQAKIYQTRKHWHHFGIDKPMEVYMPESERLNGTPLNPALLISPDIHRRFVERTKAEIVNMVVLTDGESDDALMFKRPATNYRGYGYVDQPNHTKVQLTHRTTRKSVEFSRGDVKHTKGLAKLVGEITGANMICFDIVESTGRRTVSNKMFRWQNWNEDGVRNKIDTVTRQFRKEGIYVIENMGWTEHYLILGGDALDIDDDEFEVDSNAGHREILKAFSKARSNKQQSRVLLGRFIEMIA